MAKHRNNAASRRKKPTGKRPLLILILVVILIGLAFFLLETLRRTVPETVSEKPVSMERYKMRGTPSLVLIVLADQA